MTLSSFIDELDSTALADTDGYRSAQRITVDAADRAAVAVAAVRHGLTVDEHSRYTAWARHERGRILLSCSERPRAHVAVGLAHALTDWDQRLRAGDQSGMPNWAAAAPTGVADMAERLTGDLFANAGDITRRLRWAVDDALALGEYGSDPQPTDSREHTLAALLEDGLSRESYHCANDELAIAAEEGLRSAHLVRSAPLLAGHTGVALARPAAGSTRARGQA